MPASTLALIASYVVAGAFVVTWLLFAFWRIRSQMKRHAAGDAVAIAARDISEG